MKILIVSKCPTHPTNAGNRWAILAQVKMFEKLGHEVHFLYILEKPLRKDASSYIVDMQQTCEYFKDKAYVFKVSKLKKFRMSLLKYVRIMFFNWHYKVDDNYPYGLGSFVRKINNKEHFDICIVNYYFLTRLFNSVDIPKKTVFTHDCFAYKDLKVGEKTLCITADTEAKAMQRCTHIFAIQDLEAAYFQLISPRSKVYNIYGRFFYKSQDIAGNMNITFLASDNIYNQNGIKWFLKSVWPLIRERFPQAKLLVGGSIGKVVKELSSTDGVEVLGYIDDVSAFYAQGDVTINPTYQGTGLKIKTFEALSYDKVTMVHPHSMEGAFQKDTAPLFASDKPVEWVKFLETVWGHEDRILDIKVKNKAYMARMDKFIESEYIRFLES